ncbi:MAG TPA: type IX secretion system protein PorQ [Flavihumibacter sp.]|jgi:hypothetical protein
MLIRLSILLIFLSGLGGIHSVHAQSAGGRAVYSFLGLPAGVQQTALGGENVSTFGSDLALSAANPALLRANHSQNISLSFTPMPAGIKQFFAAGAYTPEGAATNFAMQVKYIGYGSLQATDPAGNNYGEFNPRDYLLQFSASRRYLGRWHYGAALKFIQSNYGAYRSSAIAMDIGLNYYDSSAGFQYGMVMKNMGFQLRSYSGEGSENLPFDLQLGITKRLARAPLQFSLTARELHRLILFKPDSSRSTLDQVAQHFVLGAQAFVGQHIELAMGYNHLRRKELMIPSTANGLTGFSTGIGLLFTRFQIRYAHAWYTSSKGYHQIGLGCSLN